MLDAVCLVNLFHKLESPFQLKDITAAFETYFEARLPVTKAAIQASAQTANLIHGQGLAADIMRKIVFNLPAWIQAASIDKMQVRSFLDFLPIIPDRGSKPIPPTRPASTKSSVPRED
jgi:2-polyprenyl-6-methoxyphenol hydroxylase-like FAD-dependent oxidoreductase